jgi:hypothetical protein
MKALLFTAATLFVLSGCSMTTQTDEMGNNFVGYKSVKVVTSEEAKMMPRAARSFRIMSDMEQVGFEHVYVSTVIDSVSISIASVYENQYALMQKYQTIVDNHRDVMSFIQANQNKSAAELEQEIRKFDAMAQSPSERIGPKIKQYQMANEQIQAENIKLAKELAIQAGKLAMVFKDNSDAILGLEGVTMLLNAGKMDDAYDLAEVRIHLSGVANDFISDEKAVLEVTKQIQSVLETKL